MIGAVISGAIRKYRKGERMTVNLLAQPSMVRIHYSPSLPNSLLRKELAHFGKRPARFKSGLPDFFGILKGVRLSDER